MRSNREWRNRWASTRTNRDVIRVVVTPDVHQGVMFNYPLEDVHGSQTLLGPRAVPLLEGGVKVPAQEQPLARIQRAEKGGRLLIESQLLWARCQGVNVDEVDHERLHTDPEVQQVARHSLGDPQHLGPKVVGE
ncbi:unnamed protein product [Caretta caretta]